jgi:hypothetical protein
LKRKVVSLRELSWFICRAVPKDSLNVNASYTLQVANLLSRYRC